MMDKQKKLCRGNDLPCAQILTMNAKTEDQQILNNIKLFVIAIGRRGSGSHLGIPAMPANQTFFQVFSPLYSSDQSEWKIGIVQLQGCICRSYLRREF
jgi:hypothetical protein